MMLFTGIGSKQRNKNIRFDGNESDKSELQPHTNDAGPPFPLERAWDISNCSALTEPPGGAGRAGARGVAVGIGGTADE